MTDINGPVDTVAQFARISERVDTQGRDIADLRTNMNAGFGSIQASLANLSSEMRTSGKTQWGQIWTAVGVGLAIITTFGGFFFSTITGRIDTFQSTYETNRALGRADYDKKLEQASERLDRLQDQAVPRPEIENRLSDVQRQLDRLNK